MMGRAVYDDGTYSVTDAIIATPRRFYPLAGTSASIRRDPLWVALGISAFSGLSIGVYGDLLFLREIALLVTLSGLSLVAGQAFVILRIDAIGHPRVMIFGRRKRICRLFAAIRDSRRTDPLGYVVGNDK